VSGLTPMARRHNSGAAGGGFTVWERVQSLEEVLTCMTVNAPGMQRLVVTESATKTSSLVQGSQGSRSWTSEGDGGGEGVRAGVRRAG
jgi:hypothetical protein